MFGYISINKQEMKFKDYDKYQSYYCGLCKCLKKKHGLLGQLTLSYDMTFVVMLLNALYESDNAYKSVRCIAHPFVKHPARTNYYTQYCADMNVILSYEKCMDDWKDEKKLSKRIYALLLSHRVKTIKDKYPEKNSVIISCLDEIHDYEKRNERNIDFPSGAFGRLMSEILACHHDEWEHDLREMGFYLGKYIYILDAYEDRNKDIKTGNYNPLNDSDDVKAFLTMMISECSRAFERLPIVEDIEILRNILYSGVWGKYNMITKKEHEEDK